MEMTLEESMRQRGSYLFGAWIYWLVGRCATCQCPAIDLCGRLQNLNRTSGLHALTRSEARALRIAGMTTAKLQTLPCFSCSLCAAGLLQQLSIPTSSLLPPSRWLFATANPPEPETRPPTHSSILIPTQFSCPLHFLFISAAPKPRAADHLL